MTTSTPAATRSSADPKDADKIILVSNRGPIEHDIDDLGRIRTRNAGGGVAVALSTVARQRAVKWIAGACSFADRIVALTGRSVSIGAGSTLRLVDLPDNLRTPFYSVVCNPLLWFVQHSLTQELSDQHTEESMREAWQTGYAPANRLFANAVVDELNSQGGRGQVMLHDYHLYLAARHIRRECPEAVLQQYVHIPWPALADWSILPSWMVRQILRGLLANDSLAFQTDTCVENFFATCKAYLPAEIDVNVHLGKVEHEDGETYVWSNPISVDVQELEDLKLSPEIDAFKQTLTTESGEQTIVRVDRLDPSKNILRGFEAFDLLLQRRPELRGKVNFLAFLVPSRSDIPEYAAYVERVFGLVDEINARYGTDDWTPIRVHFEQNRDQAMAGMCLYDVLLVNSVADGMNLVSKEGPIVNERDGAVVLSVEAGSYEALAPAVIGIDPWSVRSTADGIERALSLSTSERAARAEALRATIHSNQLSDWTSVQVKDMEIARYMKTAYLATG